MKKAAAVASALLFPWEKPRGLFSWLPLFVLFSLLAHAGTFFVFQVVYPERATIPPAPPQITMLLPTPANAALLRWIEAEDPALVAISSAVTPPRLVKAEYRPSYGVIRTAPRSLAESAPGAEYPPEREPLDIIRSGSVTPGQAASVVEPQPTALTFSGPVSSRAMTPATMRFSKSRAPLAPAKFLIGVTDRGEARYVFPQQSSGNPTLDAEAAAVFRDLSFAPGAASVTWGFATFRWGDDAYTAEPAP